MCLEEKEIPRKQRVVEVWKPPDTGWIKVNTDGAFLMLHLGKVLLVQS